MRPVKRILLVCTGNSCRSVMAEAYLKKRAGEESLQLEIRSAGTLGVDGLEPTPEVFQVLKEDNILPPGDGSTAIDRELLQWADLVLVMTPGHRSQVREILPGIGEKVKKLSEFHSRHFDAIPDPIGNSVEYYRNVYSTIKISIEGLIKWLKEQ